jgi:hypothetical protein
MLLTLEQLACDGQFRRRSDLSVQDDDNQEAVPV